ncbi:androglobin-like [Mercenaria mercenaria]|uniref:androglobin-like n=1 Tax=Mercenaria mercenaria TaxID=6596 RepID=UPI00234F9F19|nr:androglobin-like [Mercenaria mercenaria]
MSASVTVIFSEALYTTLRKVLRDVASPEIAFAWRAFMFDATSKNILSIPAGSRPATGHTSHRGSAKPAATKGAKQTVAQTEEQPEKTSSSWENRQATTEEQVATVKLQKQWKGYWVRKIRAARTPGSDENQKVLQNLQKCWAIIEQNLDPSNPDHPGLFLFRQMFKLDPDLMVKYPFYKDEWNKISYNDYKGQYPDQPPNNWFVVFREVFLVMEEMLAVPKLYVPISTCMLRVINNDTGEEIPRVFQKVAPYVYKKNRKGYTFVAEARTTDQPLQTGTWRMRMIGSLSPLPAPLRGEVNSSFAVKEIKDYYLPNSKNVIFRYAVKVTEDHLTSIQMNTSKSDVHIKLVVLNNEEEVASTLGKGHAVIPAFTFLKDINPDEEPKRSTSRALHGSDHSNKGESKTKKGGKRGGSGKSNDGRGSTPTPTARSPRTPPASGRSPRRSSQVDHHSDGGLSDGDLEERDLRPHKYIIEAQVLKDSWPLSEASWAFVQMLKEMEKNELKGRRNDRLFRERIGLDQLRDFEVMSRYRLDRVSIEALIGLLADDLMKPTRRSCSISAEIQDGDSTEITELKTDLKQRIESMESSLISKLNTEVGTMKAELQEKINRMDMNLMTIVQNLKDQKTQQAQVANRTRSLLEAERKRKEEKLEAERKRKEEEMLEEERKIKDEEMLEAERKIKEEKLEAERKRKKEKLEAERKKKEDEKLKQKENE